MSDLALLYIGALTPDPATTSTEATSSAGEIFQRNFITAIGEEVSANLEVVTYVPVPSFPRSPLFVFARRDRIVDGPACQTVGHVNLGAIKIFTLGFTTAWQVARWAGRHRGGKQKVALLYNLNAPPASILQPICRLLNIKLVSYIGDINVPGEVVADGPFRRLEFWLQKRILPKMDGLLVCNRAILEDFAPNRKAIFIEGAVPVAFVDRFSKPPKGHPGFHIVFAGSLTDLNGITVLLDALKLIDEPDLRVSIAGRGPYESRAREAAKEDSRIDMLGLVPHERVLELYDEADLLLSLRRTGSRSERYVFPSKVVECLATGRPLLTTATGNVAKDFHEFVFLLPELTAHGLANRIREVMAMSQTERMGIGHRAQAFVRADRTWKVYGTRLAEYLRSEVLSKAR